MSPTKKPEAEATDLLTKFKLNSKLPIRVDSLAKSLRIEIKYERFDEDLSGVLVKEATRAVIGVNSSHAITRQRFTIAHELGHLVLGHEGEVFVDKTLRNQAMVIRRDGKSSLGIDEDEVQANRFAAELLMPKDLIAAQAAKTLGKKSKLTPDELVQELARTFQVSQQAMEYRLTNLGYLIPS